MDKSSWYNHLQEIYFLNVNASCPTYIQSLKSLRFAFQMKQKKPMNVLRGLKLFTRPSDTFCNRDNGIIAIAIK